MSLQLPSGWHWGIGEGSRSLSDGGYYMHYAQKRIWANQHRDVFVEVRVDTINIPAAKHHIDVTLYEEYQGEIREIRLLGYHDVEVIDPDREASQRWAARKAHERAVEYMERVNDGQYDLSFRSKSNPHHTVTV